VELVSVKPDDVQGTPLALLSKELILIQIFEVQVEENKNG
jgi:hypothetical protein